MSSINGITGGNPSVYTVYAGSTASAAPAVTSNAPAASDAPDASGSTSGVGGHRHHHHRAGGAGDFQKIADAVTTALQSAKSDPSADPNKAVEDAIASVFKDHPPTAATPDGADAPQPDATSAADTNTDASKTTGSPPSRAAFFDTLKSYGIDPKQFHQDLLAAVQDARGGSTDPAAAFKNVPPGVAVDTEA